MSIDIFVATKFEHSASGSGGSSGGGISFQSDFVTHTQKKLNRAHLKMNNNKSATAAAAAKK